MSRSFRRGLSRRDVIRGAGGVLALPFLESFMRPAQAFAGAGPKRFILVTHQQGVVMNQWAPTGSETSFTLPAILAPLAPWQDRMVAIAGLDNRVPNLNSAGNGHENADLTLLTGTPYQDQSAAVLTAGGPSIEQVIAERISFDKPYSRLDFGVGGGTSGGGLVSSPKMFAGAGDAVSVTNDPDRIFASLFAGQALSPAELAALRARRASVLDGVLESFNGLHARLGPTDQARLDAHATKVRELEQRVTSEASSACAAPQMGFPTGYDFGFDDDVTTPSQIALMVEAMACDQTRVGTLSFLTGHDPTFPWLSVNGGPVVPTGAYDNWHAMVHEGRAEPGLVAGFTWYAQMVAGLVAALQNKVDVDGDNLLDTTCILWTTEFGNGAGHNTLKVPMLLLGNVGAGVGTGRFLDLMNGGPDADWSGGDHCTNELFVSLLQAFGQPDTTFGSTDPLLTQGPLAGFA
jgi:hypothetical protein